MSHNVLRKGLGDDGASILVPKSDPLICHFEGLDVDALAFEALIAQGTPETLAQAAALYEDDLLDGIDIRSDEFNHWLTRERERLHGLAIDCLLSLLRLRKASRDWNGALETAHRILAALEELSEEAHCAIIDVYLRLDQRAAARKHAQVCQALFEREHFQATTETQRVLQRALGTADAGSRDTVEYKLAAILSADVAGYGRLVDDDEAGTFERLRVHRKQLFEPEIAKHRGAIFKLMGDGLLAEFNSAVDAVECAVVLQRKMAEANADVPPRQRIDVRMGVNVGDVIVEGDDRHGDVVIIATRLQQIAEPGSVCVSRTAYNHVWHKLPLAFEDLGEQHLKNIAEPVRVYRVRLDEVSRLVANGHSAHALALPDRPSIAVLPFRNLSDDGKWARLADGITEDVTTSLSRSRDLFVIARNSTEVYRDKALDLRAVGHDLGVRYLLEGSIQAFDGRVRATARLIDAASRSHLWSEQYDRATEDIFRIQDDVTANIAGRLLGNEGALNEAEREKLRRKLPSSLKAYDHYLLAMQAKHALTREDLDKARQLFDKALELDPGLARAHVGLAWICELEIGLGFTPSVEQSRASKLAHAQKAVALDSHDGEAHAALATCYADEGDFDRAAQEFGRAEALAPNNADILLFHGSYLPQLGDPALAAEKVGLAVRLNPNYPPWYNRGLRSAHYFASRFDQALAAARAAGLWAANDHAWLAVAAAQLGRSVEARQAATMVLALDPDWSAERRMSDFGKFARATEPLLFADGARKAGLPVCASAAQRLRWPEMTPLPDCEQERAQS